MTLLEKEREAAVKKAVEFIKSCPLKGTAIKVELEAELGRDADDDECYPCNGSGTVYEDDDEVTCDRCDGVGVFGANGDWGEAKCSEFIKAHVSKEARNSLIFSKFYNDGSVDSEFTFTVPIDKPQYVIEYIKAFKLLAEEIGNGIDTAGAGMHTAILNSAKGTYPSGCTLSDARVTNFNKALEHLMPALYFLSSCDHNSRPLNYREPRFSRTNKYNAVASYNHVLEYRCFETCYDRPEAFYDYICVIANSLKFYSLRPKQPSFFGKIGEVGIAEGYGVDRFFYTVKHLEALEAGVSVLRPSYKTFTQLKRERNFCVSKTKLLVDERKLESKWKQEFKEFKERATNTFEGKRDKLAEQWDRLVLENGLESMYRYLDITSKEKWIESQLNSWKMSNPDNESDYINLKKGQIASTVHYTVTV